MTRKEAPRIGTEQGQYKLGLSLVGGLIELLKQ